MSLESLNEQRIEELTTEILLLIKGNYIRGPISRDRVYEALNALAVCTSVTVRGAGNEALEWFTQALNSNLKTND